jgi:hypothetical protein
MRPGNLARILFLTMALVLVILAIRGMNSGKTELVFQALGLSPGTSDSPGVEPGGRRLRPGDERFNVCKTRIHSLEWSSGPRIEETQEGFKMRWMAFDPQPHEVGYLEMERWLSHHCQIVVHPVDPSSLASLPAISSLHIHYVDDSEAKYDRFEGNVFRVEQRTFHSDDLAEAISELGQIAQITPSNGM